jgi:DNA-directed RNA polymerase alpha subunit
MAMVKFIQDPDDHYSLLVCRHHRRLGDVIKLVSRDLLDIRADDLELSVRTANCLYQSLLRPIVRVGDLIRFTPHNLLMLKNFGRKSLREVMMLLDEMGLSLGADHIDWEPSPDSAVPADITKKINAPSCLHGRR